MSEQSGADLSRLRINRESGSASDPAGGRGVGKAVLLYGTGVLVIGLGLFFLLRILGGEVPTVDVAVVGYVSPSLDRTVLTASGYVVAQRKAAIASKATGRIVGLYFLEGDKVRKGDVIARIESADVEASLEQAKADLEYAAASLQDARRGFERADTLLRRNLISQAEFDAAESKYQANAAAVRSREAAVKAAGVAFENTNIRAPFDGTVLTKNADIGEVVAPFAAGASSRVAVVTIADMNSLQVEADVSEANIPSVVLGQPVEVTLDAYPERRYRAQVDKIVPTADRAKATVLTKIRFLEKDGRVLPEMGAKAHFLRADTSAGSDRSGTGGGSASSILAVDSRAIVRGAAGPSLFVLEGNVVRSVQVQTGRTLGVMVELLGGGIAPGTKVVLDPPEGLGSGNEVKLRK